jgi:hypothetical protein
MTLTLEQFQQDAKRWLAQLRDTGKRWFSSPGKMRMKSAPQALA